MEVWIDGYVRTFVVDIFLKFLTSPVLEVFRILGKSHSGQERILVALLPFCGVREIMNIMSSLPKTGRNEQCPCGSLKPDGTPEKYKRCCERRKSWGLPRQVFEHFLANQVIPVPFEKGGFLTGRRFITETAWGMRIRAVGNRVFKRPIDETFHMFLFRTFSDVLTKKWVEAEEKLADPHQLVKWFKEAQSIVTSKTNGRKKGQLNSVQLTGNMRALLAIAYDFYSLLHCGAPVPKSILNRLRTNDHFQGARYEIAVAALACRSGFRITWTSGKDKDKHCEFIGTHQITGDKAAFEVKSHHRGGVLGRTGDFDPSNARIKIMDHIKEAIEQTSEDMPLIIFDDLNLPITPGVVDENKKWFKEVEGQLQKYGFLESPEYMRCGALIVTNFSWHFHTEIPPEQNELVMHFHLNNKYSLKPDTLLKYLELAAQQYGHVPALAHEFKDWEKDPQIMD